MPELIINGPAGRLECQYMPGVKPEAPTALILHPEPDKRGTMNNRITYATYKLFQARGFGVMRFNFRGVGKSQGHYDYGDGELADAATALDWLQTNFAASPICWIAGFSFGSLIAMQLMMRRPEITSFIALSPPALTEDFTFLAPCPVSGLIIHGSQNNHIPSFQVEALVEKIAKQKGVIIDTAIIKGANHFFSTHLEEAMGAITAYLDRAEDGRKLPENITESDTT